MWGANLLFREKVSNTLSTNSLSVSESNFSTISSEKFIHFKTSCFGIVQAAS